MPKKVTGEGLGEGTVDRISGAFEFAFQIFRSLQGYHLCTIVRHTGIIGGNPILGFAPTNTFDSIYNVEVEVDIFSVEEVNASQGMIKMSDKKFEVRVPLKIGDVIAIFGVTPTDTIDDGGTEREPDFNNLDDCNLISKPQLHGVGIEDDPDNKSYVQFYRIYKVEEDDRMNEWVGYGRFVKSPIQDGSSPSGDEIY